MKHLTRRIITWILVFSMLSVPLNAAIAANIDSGEVEMVSPTSIYSYHAVDEALSLKWKTTSGKTSYCNITIKVLPQDAYPAGDVTIPETTSATLLATTKVYGTSSFSKTISVSSLQSYAGRWLKVYIDGYDSSGNRVDVPGGCYVLLEESAEDMYINLSRYSYSADKNGATNIRVDVESNIDWIVETSRSWITVSKTSGSGNGYFTFSVDKNTISERAGYIYVMDEGKYIDEAIRVTQEAGAEPYVEVIPLEYEANPAGETFTVNVSSNTDWTVKVGKTGAGWLTVNKSSGAADGSFKVTVSQNTTGSERTGKILIDSADGEIVNDLYVTQGVSALEIFGVTWEPQTIIEDTNTTFLIETSNDVDSVQLYIDTYLLDTITSYTENDNHRVFSTTQAIQNPGLRTLKAVAYRDSVASDPYTTQITVETADLEKLEPVVITTPLDHAVITRGNPLAVKWNMPANVTSVDRYIVKVWNYSTDSYCYEGETASNSITVHSSNILDCGEYFVVITALKNGYQSSDSQVYFSVEEDNVPQLTIPAIISPSAYAQHDASEDLEFSWGKVSEATAYPYTVSDITNGEPGTVILSGSQSTRSVTVPGAKLLAGHVVKFCVSAKAEDGRESSEAFVYATIVKTDATINTSVEELVFSSAEGSKAVTLTSPVSWTASVTKGSDWITLSHTSGTSGREITVSVSENNGQKVRNGIIRFDNSSGTVYVSVSQGSSASAYLELSKADVQMDASRGLSEEITVQSNCGWYVESDSDWLFASTYHCVYDGTLQVCVEANATMQSRTGTLTITASDVIKSITVTQEGAQKPTIEGFTSSYSVPLGKDVDLQGIVRAQGDGILKKVTIKCNNAGGMNNEIASEVLSTSSYDLSRLKVSTNNSNIFNGPGTYEFVIYAAADNFAVTDNSLQTFEIVVTEAINEPCIVNTGVMNLAATSVTLNAQIESFGGNTYKDCHFQLFKKINGQMSYVGTYWIAEHPHGNSTSVWTTVTNHMKEEQYSLEPGTEYAYYPVLETEEGNYEGDWIWFTTPDAVAISGAEIQTFTGAAVSGTVYSTVGKKLTYLLKPKANIGDVKSWKWSISGTGISLSNAKTEKCVIALKNAGTYTLSATIEDYFGGSYQTSLTIVVKEAATTYELNFIDSFFNNKLSYQFTFDPNFFAQPSTVYNHDLAKLSMGLLLAGQSTTMNDITNGNETSSNRLKTIKGMYEAFGFTEIKDCNYDLPLSEDDDKIAFSLAHRTVTIDGEESDLYLLVTRGAHYGAEWVSNFNVIDSSNRNEHTGFFIAANRVESWFALQNIKISEKTKILITGFSRTAAVSNLVAEWMNNYFENNGGSKNNVYAYTFATPNVTRASVNAKNDANIFNIVSPDDLVPTVPMAGTGWGYHKYGYTLSLPSYQSNLTSGVYGSSGSMQQITPYYTTKDYVFQDWDNQQKAVKVLNKLIINTFGSVDNFRVQYQGIVTEALILANRSDATTDVIEKWIDILYYLALCTVCEASMDSISKPFFGIAVGSAFTEAIDLIMGDQVMQDAENLKKLAKALAVNFIKLSEDEKSLITTMVINLNFQETVDLLVNAYGAVVSLTPAIRDGYINRMEGYLDTMESPAKHIALTHKMENYLAWL